MLRSILYGLRARREGVVKGGGPRSALFLILLFVSSCATGPALERGAEPVHHLVILHTNDHHGHPLKFPYGQSPAAGGIPARATLVGEIRKDHPNVLLLDAGDLNTGRAESNLFKARPDIEGYNALGYDAMAIGNHEFDNPVETLRQQMQIARFPFLSANIRTRDGSPLAEPHVIKEFSGFKVAVFGLTLRETPTLANPFHLRDLEFLDEIKTAEALVPALRKEADLVVALAHLGIFDTPQRGSRRLASRVSGIDVIVDGHTHTRLDRPLLVRNPSGGDTLIVQAWKWGLVLGRLDLWIQGGRIRDHRYKAIPINLNEGRVSHSPRGPPEPAVAEDPALLALLQPYEAKADALLSETIGFAEDPHSSRKARSGESPIGNLVADSMQWLASRWGADFSLLNGGAIRGDLARGPVSLRSVYDLIPFENSIVLVTLEGAEVGRLFDFMASIPEGSGAFPQLSNEVRCILNRSATKAESVLISGKAIEKGRKYRIAVPSFLAGGGDRYTFFPQASERVDTRTPMQPNLIEYIRSMGGRLNPQVEGRIVIQ